MLDNKDNSKKEFIHRSSCGNDGSQFQGLKKLNLNYPQRLSNNFNQTLYKSQRHTLQTPYIDFWISDNNDQGQQPNKKQLDKKVAKIQNYLGSHNKYKTSFKTKEYSKIYQQLTKIVPTSKQYFSIYLQDKFFSLNKHIKNSIIKKETCFLEYLNPYFQAGKSLIQQFYSFFLVDDELFKGTKKVNAEVVVNRLNGINSKINNVNQFIYATITFLYQLAVFYRSNNQRNQAKKIYYQSFKIVCKILESSNSCSRLRRKISQFLISFSSFLIENRKYIKALKILELGLQNVTNLIGIIETKLKYSSQTKIRQQIPDKMQIFRKKIKRKLRQAFNFMITIYLNNAIIYQFEHQSHLSYYSLKEAQYLENILNRKYQIKSKIQEIIKKPQEDYQFRHQITHILKCYFDFQKIIKSLTQDDLYRSNQSLSIKSGKNFYSQPCKIKDVYNIFFQNNNFVKKNSRKQLRQSLISDFNFFLIKHDSKETQNQENKDQQKYVITMTDVDRSSKPVYKQKKKFNQTKLSANNMQLETGRRNTRKLSKFYSLANTQKQIQEKQSSKKMHSCTNNQINRKSIAKFAFIQQKSIKLEEFQKNQQNELNNKIRQKTSKNDFLDQLIDSQLKIKQYLLYGKNFRKNDPLSKGKSLYQKNIPNQYNSNIIQIKNKNISNTNNEQSKKLINQIDESNKLYQKNTTQQQLNWKSKWQAKRSLSLKPMSYQSVIQKIQRTQIQLMKSNTFEKNSIYKLKCKSQNLSVINSNVREPTQTVFKKQFIEGTRAIQISLDKQNQREILISKLQNNDKFHLKDKESKEKRLKKKTLHCSNLFSSNETGVRLLKNIIFKYKKVLKLTKPNIFIYQKKNLKQFKLIQKDSLLRVQYQMCEEQTKARIKENIQCLIAENLKKSEENQKRVEKINKIINYYDKKSRLNEFNAKINEQNRAENTLMQPNSQYFIKKYGKNSVKDENSSQLDQNSKQNDKAVKKLYQNRVLSGQIQGDMIGFGQYRCLTGNEMTNPNLFLSSIKYNEDSVGSKNTKSDKIVSKQKI